jgi:hypothetical protein
LVRRLASQHPDQPVEIIAEFVACALRDTSTARVHGFRLILAERTVRKRPKGAPSSRTSSRQVQAA